MRNLSGHEYPVVDEKSSQQNSPLLLRGAVLLTQLSKAQTSKQIEELGIRENELISRRFCLSQLRREISSIGCFLFILYGVFFTDIAQSAELLVPGDSGGEVIKLQKDLVDKGFYNGSVDGYYGDETKQAVTRFQQASNLPVDGIAGEQTQLALQGRLSLAPQGVAAQAFGQTATRAVGGFSTAPTSSEILALIVFSGLAISIGTTVLKSNEPTQTSIYQPFKFRSDLYFKSRYLAHLGYFDPGTAVKVTLSASSDQVVSLDGKTVSVEGSVILTESDLPKGRYTFVAEGIRNGEKVTKKGSFTI